MSMFEGLTTLLGGFLLAFFALLIWGRLVKRFGGLGGVLAAVGLIGCFWWLNHGMSRPLIVQPSSVFVDMGFAVATGVLVYGLSQGQPFQYHRANLLAAIIGGAVAGLILYSLGF
ncbi:hypothetical protein GRB29_01350 [Streptococcus pneumoniae]|nr:hypothetical protein [Streptococcus pneumoniae]